MVVRMLVRLLSVIIVFLVCAFVFLRVYGVPKPLLSEIIQRINARGIPVDVEHVSLTLRGWKAERVSFYSKHPDDLLPLFKAKEILLAKKLLSGVGNGSEYDIKAWNVYVNTSVAWGVEFPAEEGWHTIEQINLALGFHDNAVSVRNASASWMGTTIGINGKVIGSQEKDGSPPSPGKKKAAKNYISSAQFNALKKALTSFEVNGAAKVDLTFTKHLDHPEQDQVNVDFLLSDWLLKEVRFSELKAHVLYTNKCVQLTEAMLVHNNRRLQMEAAYCFASGQVSGSIKNDITAAEILSLFPANIRDVLDLIQLEFGQLPNFLLNFGPSKYSGLLDHLEGSFSILDTTYCGLHIKSLAGVMVRRNGRLELNQLKALIAGQEHRADQAESCLGGGAVEGSVFWDENEAGFGVAASGRVDPVLFIEPLAMVQIATNVIDRFKFGTVPPEITLSLGACYTNWSTFYIKIDGVGHDLRLHEATLSSLNTLAYYEKGVLTLDPLTASQDGNVLKGMASIDFRDSTAFFDATSSIHPDVIEDAIYPGFNLFGNSIRTGGQAEINAVGTLDWERMQATDFSAAVQVDVLEIPFAQMKTFKGEVTGKGPLISVSNTAFDLFGGKGSGAFSIALDPSTNSMPYAMDIHVAESNFDSFLKHINPNIEGNFGGLLSGDLTFDADMIVGFDPTANGFGNVSIQEGQLADLPFFKGFSRLIRKMMPSFNIFSITSLKGTFHIIGGVIHSDDAYFEGDVISANGKGNYSQQEGFDAVVSAQIMSNNPVSKVIQVITNPIFKLFELNLKGSISDPSWGLEKFHMEKSKTFPEAEDSD